MPVITFSRHFPAYHPRKGELTFFPEMLLNSFGLGEEYVNGQKFDWLNDFVLIDGKKKVHTIRSGNRWKVGDVFSPRVWSRKPYASKQIEFAPDIEIKKVWDIEMFGLTILVNNKPINSLTLREIALNDGLSLKDFQSWFNKLPFKGQIICWNKNIEY